jgi:anti-anti-sigma factor
VGEWSVEVLPDGATVMALRGDVDLAMEESLIGGVDGLLMGRDARLVIDLRSVDFIDSSGVRALMVVRRNHPGRVTIGQLSDPVRAVFETAGVHEWLIDPTPETSPPPSGPGRS